MEESENQISEHKGKVMKKISKKDEQKADKKTPQYNIVQYGRAFRGIVFIP